MRTQNGGNSRHLPSWFTIDFVLINEYIKDTEGKKLGSFIVLTILLNALKNIYFTLFSMSN